MINTEQTARIACSFISHFYKGFQSDLPSLIRLYNEQAVSSYAPIGEAVATTSQGRAEVAQHLERLNAELGARKVLVKTADFVPTPDGGIVINVGGAIYTKRVRQLFTQTFVLAPTKNRDNTLHIAAESLRLVSKESEVIPEGATVVNPAEEARAAAAAAAAAAALAEQQAQQQAQQQQQQERPVRERKERAPREPRAARDAAPAVDAKKPEATNAATEKPRREPRAERTDRQDRPERPERAQRTDRTERPERVERPERAERQDRKPREAREPRPARDAAPAAASAPVAAAAAPAASTEKPRRERPAKDAVANKEVKVDTPAPRRTIADIVRAPAAPASSPAPAAAPKTAVAAAAPAAAPAAPAAASKPADAVAAATKRPLTTMVRINDIPRELRLSEVKAAAAKHGSVKDAFWRGAKDEDAVIVFATADEARALVNDRAFAVKDQKLRGGYFFDTKK